MAKDHLNKKWKTAKCSVQDCWCRLIVTEDCPTGEDADYPLEYCILCSGAIDAETAEHIVSIHNQWIDSKGK